MITLKKLQNISSTRFRRLLHVVKVFKGRSPVYPRFVQLLLTYKCNANCPFCYQDAEKKKIPDMSISDAQIIERNIRKSFNFKPRIHFFGGEPTVNADFVEILKHFSNSGYRISMTTNGINLLKFGREIAEAKGFKEIHISLNDLDFDRVLSTLKQISDIDVNNSLYITLNCPVTEINQDKLLDIVEKFEHSKAQCITFQHRGFIWHNGFTSMDHKLIKDQYEIIRKRKSSIPIMFHPNIKSKDIEAYYTDKEFPYNRNECYFPWFVLFVQPNGNIIPCDEINITVGNAVTESLKNIWNNSEYVAFRRNIIQNGISHSICHRCDHRDY